MNTQTSNSNSCDEGDKPVKRRRRSSKSKLSLPPDIIFDVLIRVPVSSLLRFKHGSKLLYSIITDPIFVDAHLSRSSSISSQSLIMCYSPVCNNELVMYSAESLRKRQRNPIRINLDSSTNQQHVWQVSESVNGLICVSENNVVKICNPTTKQVTSLPLLPSASMIGDEYFTYIGFDYSTRKYKILNLKVSHHKTHTFAENRVFILESNNKWKTIIGFLDFIPARYFCSKFHNGVIYFIGYHARTEESYIVEFDTSTEQFCMITMIKKAKNWKLLGFIEGKMAVAADDLYLGLNFLVIWMLDRHNKVWIKRLITLPSLPFFGNLRSRKKFQVLGFIHTGEIILVERTEQAPIDFFVVDYRRNTYWKYRIWRQPDFLSCFYDINISSHVETVLSFNN